MAMGRCQSSQVEVMRKFCIGVKAIGIRKSHCSATLSLSARLGPCGPDQLLVALLLAGQQACEHRRRASRSLTELDPEAAFAASTTGTRPACAMGVTSLTKSYVALSFSEQAAGQLRADPDSFLALMSYDVL